MVNKINNIEIPSIPNLKLNSPLIQILSSINWKSDVLASKLNHIINEIKKLAREVNKATFFEFLFIFSKDPLVIKTKKTQGFGQWEPFYIAKQ